MSSVAISCEITSCHLTHDDVIKWKHVPRYWPFVRGIHRSPVDSIPKGHWLGALIFSLICAWTNRWANNGAAGDLRRHRSHEHATVVISENTFEIINGHVNVKQTMGKFSQCLLFAWHPLFLQNNRHSVLVPKCFHFPVRSKCKHHTQTSQPESICKSAGYFRHSLLAVKITWKEDQYKRTYYACRQALNGLRLTEVRLANQFIPELIALWTK